MSRDRGLKDKGPRLTTRARAGLHTHISFRGTMLERRKHTRVAINSGAYAVLIQPDGLPIGGKILDISLGGIGFAYASPTELEAERFQLQLFNLNGPRNYSERIRCKIIRNSKLPDGSSGVLFSWRCGIEFETLPNDTLERMRHFVSTLTVPSPAV
jgi:c-di-GMP-binding flagellar brake protein YcgR